MKPFHYAGAAILVAALAAAAYLGLGASPIAPVVAYTLLDGKQSSTEHFRGKVVFVNFWATSCTTCVHEMPQIVATYDKYRARGYDTLLPLRPVPMSSCLTACRAARQQRRTCSSNMSACRSLPAFRWR